MLGMTDKAKMKAEEWLAKNPGKHLCVVVEGYG